MFAIPLNENGIINFVGKKNFFFVINFNCTDFYIS